jgi:hypothetical protein
VHGRKSDASRRRKRIEDGRRTERWEKERYRLGREEMRARERKIVRKWSEKAEVDV